jgi:23S rRNA (guanosine2251-2'-O)-methyltransferase
MRKPKGTPGAHHGSSRKGRRESTRELQREETLYGIQAVWEALNHGQRRLDRLLIKASSGNRRLQEVRGLAQAQGVPVQEMDVRDLDRACTGSVHQGVVLLCGPRMLGDSSELPDPQSSPFPVLVALDQVEDPHNLGAILRTCGFLGASALVVPRDHTPPLGGAVAKSSTGVSEWFPILSVPNLHRFLKQAQQLGYWVVGLDQEEARPLKELQRDRPLILVLGNEGQGLRQLTRQTCDWTVGISGSGAVDSLNVSNAAAIALYQVLSF